MILLRSVSAINPSSILPSLHQQAHGRSGMVNLRKGTRFFGFLLLRVPTSWLTDVIAELDLRCLHSNEQCLTVANNFTNVHV